MAAWRSSLQMPDFDKAIRRIQRIMRVAAVSAVALQSGCTESSLEPDNSLRPVFNLVEAPEVTEEQWYAAIDTYVTNGGWGIEEALLDVDAIGIGQSSPPFHAEISVQTKGEIKGIWIPTLRHQVFWEVRAEGETVGGMMTDDFDGWRADATKFDVGDILALKCHVSEHDWVRAYSEHHARYAAYLTNYVPPLKKLWTTPTAVRIPATTGYLTDNCDPECPDDWAFDEELEGCVEADEDPFENDSGDGGNNPDCSWIRYTYYEWDWFSGSWQYQYHWDVEVCPDD